ncbi:preprotein translocase subunit SecG [Bartonella sp. A05]|uniref:preprotein translocase subunit SecG n=1 Tax=Bartonella sp. A05 TaxID=2967261 RepID=UPI0022A9CB11|nr:preprotein translocase subunit SecG [Bartonella sp. A05]MCZ2203764.1 preprotein translocase subunit SecG [Bartonella sp. A05]
MQTVLIVIQFLVVIALVGVVLIQPSEGGGLGVSGGSSFMKARGTKNALTRLTAILAVCFFATSISLVVVGTLSNSHSDILNRIPVNVEKNSENESETEVTPSSDHKSQPSILEQLGGVSVPSHEQSGIPAPAVENPVPVPIEDSASGSVAE